MSTQRTKAALDALFPDNTTRAITPSRLRDFLESCVPSYGALHFVDPGTLTVIAAPSLWTKASNASTLHNGAHRFSQPQSNRLQYDGATTVMAFAIATASFTAAANNQVLAFSLGVNGTVIEESDSRSKIASGSDVQAATVIAHAILSPGDYLELFIRNDTSDADITIDHGHIIAFAYMI